MKKHAPWILTVVMALWVVGGSRAPKPMDDFDIAQFGSLPVLLGGRVQPIDSVARNTLLTIRGKQSIRLAEEDRNETDRRLDRSKLTALPWLMEVFMAPSVADQRKTFMVHHPEVQALLQLPSDEKYFSFNELTNGIPEIRTQMERIREKKAELRTPFEKQMAHLDQSIVTYMRLKSSLKPEGAEDFQAELDLYRQTIPGGVAALRSMEAGQEYDARELDFFVGFFRRYQQLQQMAYPLLIPPADLQENRDGWVNIGQALMDSARSLAIPEAAEHYAAMATAFKDGKPAAFNSEVAAYRQSLHSRGLDREISKGRQEFFFNVFAPFYKSMVIYVLALLLGCASWLNLSPGLRRAAFQLVLLALVIHTVGLGFRMWLEGRPPVTNLYSSAVFVGWGAVILGCILERLFPRGIGVVVSSIAGFSTLIIAHHLSLSGDTMEMLRAVLDTNFWLATHVVVITTGYAAMFVAGLLAILYVVLGVFTRGLDKDLARMLTRMVYGIICFATLFSFVGTILGGIWADQSWGRFWGWDPKENGALLIVLWCAIVLHARWGGMIRERGLMNLAIFGNIITSFSWFGVNMLGIGLHSYGFMDKAFYWLMGFVVSQILFIGLGCLPPRKWRSFRKGHTPGTPGHPLNKAALAS